MAGRYEYPACCTKNRCFALTIPCAFAKTLKEEKNRVNSVSHRHAGKCHFYRVSEIYAWCGQTPYVMSVAAISGTGLLTVEPESASRILHNQAM
ncbi:TPA: hypothetical protein I4G69_000305 [Enterobacter asburiae]|nr:hypothetical protein [Enterobacter asburiae]